MSSTVPISLRDPFLDDPHFSSLNRDFQERRRNVMKETKDFWTKADTDNMDMTLFRDPFLMSRRTMFDTDVPYGNSMSPTLGFGGSDPQVLRVWEDDSKFEIALNVQNFKADELKVRTQPDNTIIIEGKHEEKAGSKEVPKYATSSSRYSTSKKYDDSCGFKSVLQQFSRQYTLPKECQPLKVYSNLSRDGVLVITAPKDKRAPLEREIPIPITR